MNFKIVTGRIAGGLAAMAVIVLCVFAVVPKFAPQPAPDSSALSSAKSETTESQDTGTPVSEEPAETASAETNQETSSDKADPGWDTNAEFVGNGVTLRLNIPQNLSPDPDGKKYSLGGNSYFSVDYKLGIAEYAAPTSLDWWCYSRGESSPPIVSAALVSLNGRDAVTIARGDNTDGATAWLLQSGDGYFELRAVYASAADYTTLMNIPNTLMIN